MRLHCSRRLAAGYSCDWMGAELRRQGFTGGAACLHDMGGVNMLLGPAFTAASGESENDNLVWL